MLLPTRSSPSGLSGDDSSPGTWQRRPTHCPSSGSRLQATSQSFEDGEGHHKLSQLWRPRKETSHQSWVLLHGQALCSGGGPGGAVRLAKATFLFTARSHLGDCILQSRSPRCLSTPRRAEHAELPNPVRTERRAGTADQDRRGPRRERAGSLPPLSASGGSGGRRVPGTGQHGGGRGSAPLPGACGAPAAGPGSSLVRRLGSSSPAPGPRTPSDPCLEPAPACSPPRVPEPSWNWLARQPRHPDHTGAAGGHG